MIEKLTDTEVAVIIDSLTEVKRNVVAGAYETPNIDSALAKINGMVTPSTYGLWICDDEPVFWNDRLKTRDR